MSARSRPVDRAAHARRLMAQLDVLTADQLERLDAKARLWRERRCRRATDDRLIARGRAIVALPGDAPEVTTCASSLGLSRERYLIAVLGGQPLHGPRGVLP